MERVLMYDARGNEIEVLRKEGKWDSLSFFLFNVFLSTMAVLLLSITASTTYDKYFRHSIAAAPTLESCQAVFEAEWIPGRPADPVAPQPIDAEDLPVDWWTAGTVAESEDTIELGFDTPNGWLELEEVSCAPGQIGAITCRAGTCTICTSEEK